MMLFRVRKEKANIFVDLAALLLFVGLCSSGLVLRWSLPAGSGRLQPGTGHPERPVNVLWGLDRHQWGEVHYWVAVALAVVLALHLFLHRKWILAVLRRRSPEGRALRPLLGLGGLLMLLAVPLLGPVRSVQRPSSETVSLGDVSNLTGVPTAYLANSLSVEDSSTTLVAATRISPVVGRYYAEQGDQVSRTSLYETNCAHCHGRDKGAFRQLLSLPGEEAVEALRQARPAGPHQILREATAEELARYLQELRELPDQKL